jgi:hypothetical protein
MAGTIESEAVFAQRCKAIGMSDATLNLLTTAGFSSMGSFAYGCSYVPGSGDDAPLVTFATRLNGGVAMPENIMAKVRRMFFESFTMVQADLRLRLERSDEAPARKLAVPERAARYRAQVLRLPGLSLIGELECSDALVDETIAQFDDNRIKYIRWERCTRKRDEVSGVKKLEDIIRKQADGTLKQALSSEPALADTSDNYALRNALSRRALAYDQANLITFSVHEDWTTKLFEARMRSVIPGYCAIHMEQLQRADLALFERLAEMTRDGITPDAAGVRPLDNAIRIASQEHQVTHHLNPLQASSGVGANQKRPRDDAFPETKTKGKGKGKAKAKAGQKGAGKGGKAPALPEGLQGSSRTPDGSHICFAFNFGRCDQEKKGCAKGKHVCTKCGAFHAFIGSACAAAA